MDALIAEKVMGWKWIASRDSSKPGLPWRRWLCEPDVYRTANPAFMLWDGIVTMPIDGLYDEETSVPDYSTDIAAAWKVKHEMIKKGLGQEFADRYINETPWHWVFLKTEAFCLHICRAALKTIAREER